MLDQPASSARAAQSGRPRLDLQQHLADLEAAGLLVRIDRPINKDTELSPLVRWQFIGGVPVIFTGLMGLATALIQALPISTTGLPMPMA